MGYANPSQTSKGIHTRLFSRAFIFQSGDDPPAVFVSADIGMVDQALKFKVKENCSSHNLYNCNNFGSSKVDKTCCSLLLDPLVY